MSLPGRQAHQSLLYRHDMPQRTTMLPWYHLHSNVKTFLIRPITGSSVVSYYCSLVQKRCLEATFCHRLAKTPSSLWVSLSVGACCILLFRTTLSRIILAKMGAVVKGCLVFQWVASIGITLCSVGAFVPTPHKVIPMQGENSEKASHQEMDGRYFFHIPVMRQKCSA